MGEVGKALSRKLGPAPAWVWLSLFAVGMIVLRLVRRPSPASTAGGPVQSSGPVVPIDLGPLKETSSTRVETKIWRPPISPLPRPAKLSKGGMQAWDALIAWWEGGGTGIPPDASGFHLKKKERAAYQEQLQWYQANPYSYGSMPGGSSTDYSSQVYDPTTDSYAAQEGGQLPPTSPLSHAGPADAVVGSQATPGPSPTQPGRQTDSPYRNIGEKDRGPQPIASSSSFGAGDRTRRYAARADADGTVIVHGRPSLRRPAQSVVLRSVPRPTSMRPRFWLFRGY